MIKDEAKTKTPEGIPVNSGTVAGSLYSQVVSVTVTDTDMTLEFVFINPRAASDGSRRGEVVSRVTLPRSAGEELARVIPEIVKEHEGKKKGK